MNNPYIVTTTQECEHCAEQGNVESIILSRVAVATLEKAKAESRKVVGVLGGSSGSTLSPLHLIDSLPESGGTIGPLPDGTVIEVKPTTWADLWVASGLDQQTLVDADYANEPGPDQDDARQRILDAFNALTPA